MSVILFLRTDCRFFGMPRQQRGLIGQRQDPFTDAVEQLSSVSTRILIIPTASFENGIPNESHIMALIIKDHRIRSMARRVNYTQRAVRVAAQAEDFPVLKRLGSMYGHVAMAVAGQVQMRIAEIGFSGLMDIDRDIRFLPDCRNTADMIEMPVGKKNLLNNPPIFVAQLHQFMSLSTRIDEKAVFRFIVNPEIAVYIEIALHGHTSDHDL